MEHSETTRIPRCSWGCGRLPQIKTRNQLFVVAPNELVVVVVVATIANLQQQPKISKSSKAPTAAAKFPRAAHHTQRGRLILASSLLYTALRGLQLRRYTAVALYKWICCVLKISRRSQCTQQTSAKPNE